MQPYYESDGVTLYHGDCLEVMAGLPDNSIDSIITDPPYGLEFMGKDWDHGVPGIPFWHEALRVAKPGAIMLAFGGTRTHHRLMCAIEDAGWELRDVIMWIYGSGFPKAYDISKGMDKHFDAEREVVCNGKWYGRCPNGRKDKGDCRNYGVDTRTDDSCNVITSPSTDAAKLWDGWKTALKPAYEPIIIAMKPREGTFVNNALTYGVAGFNIDECRIPSDIPPNKRNGQGYKTRGEIYGGGNGLPDYTDFTAHNAGRFPANLIHDGSQEVMALFPDTQPSKSTPRHNGEFNSVAKGKDLPHTTYGHDDNGGSAARFFYCTKASRSERNAGLESGRNNHPTVKPLTLMQYLARLTKTPTGGVVLDPFMGSCTTGAACVLEGREFIGIDMEERYCEIAAQRIAYYKKESKQLRLV